MSAPTLIDTLPAEMKLQILHKMRVVPLCRMRRTCSQMNSLIEENKKKLANRAHIGLPMRIFPCDNKIWFRASCLSERFLVEDDFFDKISAISFRSLTFDLKQGRNSINLDQFTNFVEKLDLTSDYVSIECTNEEFVNEILNGITARKQLAVGYEGIHYDRFFPHLKQTPKHEEISMVSVRVLNVEREGLFDLIKDYKVVNLSNIYQSYFNKLLEDMLLCEHPFIVKKIACETVTDDILRGIRIGPPPMKTLWDISLLPPAYRSRFGTTRISQLNLINGQCAILESSGLDEDHQSNHIHIVNNNISEIFNIVIRGLFIYEVTEEIRQGYISADEEHRKELLVSAYIANANRKPLIVERWNN